MTLLLTGFAPFGGETLNPSWEAVRRLEAGEGDPAFLKAKIATARFFAEQLLPAAPALLGPITRGAELLYAIPDEALLG